MNILTAAVAALALQGCPQADEAWGLATTVSYLFSESEEVSVLSAEPLSDGACLITADAGGESFAIRAVATDGWELVIPGDGEWSMPVPDAEDWILASAGEAPKGAMTASPWNLSLNPDGSWTARVSWDGTGIATGPITLEATASGWVRRPPQIEGRP